MNRTSLILRLAILFLIVGLVFANFSPVFASAVKQQPGLCPPGAPAIPTHPITPTDVIGYVTTNPLPHNLNANAVIDATTVRYQFTTFETTKRYLGGDDNGCPDSSQVVYVEFQAAVSSSTGQRTSFEFPGPDTTVSYPFGFEVFVVATGNLLISGGRVQPEPNLTPVPQTK
jgi:hypothetical protein